MKRKTIDSFFSKKLRSEDNILSGCSNSATRSANENSSNTYVIGTKRHCNVRVSGDGSCFFRCLATYINPCLHVCERNCYGEPVKQEFELLEKATADRLRAKVVWFLSSFENILEDLCKSFPFLLDKKIGNMYKSVSHRLASMAACYEFAGFLEIAALSFLLQRNIEIYTSKAEDNVHVLEEHTMFKLAANNKSKPIILFHVPDDNQNDGHFSLLMPILSEEDNIDPDFGITEIFGILDDNNMSSVCIAESELGLKFIKCIQNMFDSNAIASVDTARKGAKVLQSDASIQMQTLNSDGISIEKNNITENATICRDIGQYVNTQNMTTELRLSLLQELWVPDISYTFPATGKRKLRFQLHWLKRWDWLAYSKIKDGALCKYCVLFSSLSGGVGHQPLGKLVANSFSVWKDAIEEFNRHANNGYHKMCVLQANNLLSVANKKLDRVEIQINTGAKSQAIQNRKRLTPIIDTIILCGRQALALRGHRDSGPLTLNEPIENDGNFRSLLRYKVRSGDHDLANHLKMCSENATYISPKIQNEIIEACNEIILQRIIKRVNAARAFTVLADETTDIAGIEQVSVCVRYLDDETNKLREDFLQFVPVTDVTGKGLSQVILDNLLKFGLNLNYLRGQGYDGAAAMSGKFNGVQSHIRMTYPLAIYVHCCSHSLNLAISNACSTAEIRNCIGILNSVCTFFKASAKRQDELTKSIEKVCPKSMATRLKALCPTRWIERHDAVLLFLELFDAVIAALHHICLWLERDASSKAQQLLCAVKHADFIITLHILGKVLAISLPLSRELQTENMDLFKALNLASEVESTIKILRRNAEKEFNVIYEIVQKICDRLDIRISIPRTAKVQYSRDNVPTEDPQAHFRATIFIPFLENFISQLHERLLDHKSLLQSFSCLLPAAKTSQPTKKQIENMKELYNTYKDVLDYGESVAVGELSLWYTVIKDKTYVDAHQALNICDKIEFPCIHKLLRIFITLPVTTASNERSFSTIRRLKTYLRSTNGEERLNGLAMLNIHRDIEITADDVLDKLAMKPRRLDFRL